MDICRSCLSDDELCELDETFIESYNLLTNLNIRLRDGFPQFACNTCIYTVSSFIKFREQCTISETKIKKISQKIKVEKNAEVTLDNHIVEIDFKPSIMHIKSEFPETVVNDLNNIVLKGASKNKVLTENVDDVTNDHNDNDQLFCKLDETKVKIQTKKGCITKTRMKRKKKIQYKKYCCGLCQEKFDDWDLLSYHVESHKNDKKCSLCSREFSSWSRLLAHRYEHLPETYRRCHICSKKNKIVESLIFHYLNEHFGGTGQIVHCKKCDKALKDSSKINYHVSRCQTEDRELYVCDHCLKGYRIKKHLREHMKAHMLNGFRPACKECKETFETDKALKLHHKHCHSKVRCKKCYRVFNDQETLDKHDAQCLAVLCPDCGKHFDMKKTYLSHRRVHQSDHKYKCTLCPETFKWRGLFKVHLDKHNGIKSNECKICHKKFLYPGTLYTHMKRHSGSKKFACEVCQKPFVTKYHMKFHMQTHGIYLINKREKPTEKSVPEKK